jgi:hypothetical protein
MSGIEAQAGEWKLLEGDGKGQTIYVKLSSIHVVGTLRTAWFKDEFAPGTIQFPSGRNSGKYWSFALSREEFNCAEETERMAANSILYFADGSHDEDDGKFVPQPWKAAAPGTLAEGKMQFLCAWKSG